MEFFFWFETKDEKIKERPGTILERATENNDTGQLRTKHIKYHIVPYNSVYV